MSEKKRKHKHKDTTKEGKRLKKEHKKSKSATAVIDSVVETNTVHSSFAERVVRLYMHLAPIWAGDVMGGVNDQLNAFLMKYVSEVDGIVLAHSDVTFDSTKGKILNDSPFCHFFVQAKFLIWKPTHGSRLVGRVSLQSEDHIGLLIYGTFNASIPKANIPLDHFEWRALDEQGNGVSEESAEENEPSFAIDVSEENQTHKRSQYGEWVDKHTGASIGGEDGVLTFTVLDIVEANDILTVTGSL